MADGERRRRKKRTDGGPSEQQQQPDALAPLTGIARIDESDIQAVADLYMQIVSAAGRSETSELPARFHEYIRAEMELVFERMREVTDPFLRSAEFVQAKSRFYAAACEDEALKFVSKGLGAPQLAGALGELFGVHHDLLAQAQTVVSTMATFYRTQLADARSKLSAAEKETRALLEAAERVKRQAGHGDELERLRAEVAQLRAARGSGSAGASGAGAKDGAKSAGKSAGSPPTRSAAKAKASGGATRQLAVAADSSDDQSGSDDVRPITLSTLGGSRGAPSAARPKSAGPNKPAVDSSKPLPITLSESFQRLTQPKKTPAQRAAEEEATKRKERKKPPAFRPDLKLKNLHVLIEEIYHSKWKYNKISEQSQLPHETMEEHVFTFLNHKYGLKPIIEGWLDALKRALARYFHDPDVKCFAFILNNRLHEDYIFGYHYAIKRTANQLLLSMLRIENPKVSDAEITELFQERLNDHLTQAEWIFLVQQIYAAPQDQTRVTALVTAHITESHRKEKEARKAKAASEFALQPYASLRREEADERKLNIAYRAFVKVVLDYQLDGYSRFLGDFAELFQEIWARGKDNDDYVFAEVLERWRAAKDANPELADEPPTRVDKVKGVLSEVEFADLVRALDPTVSQSDVTSYLAEADPFETGRITFSRAVVVLADLLKSVAMAKDLAEDGAQPAALTTHDFGGSDQSDLSFPNELITH